MSTTPRVKPKRVTLWTVAYAYRGKARLTSVDGTMTATRIRLDTRCAEFAHAASVPIDSHPYTPEDAIRLESERLDSQEENARAALARVEKKRAALAVLQGAAGLLSILEGPTTPESTTP